MFVHLCVHLRIWRRDEKVNRDVRGEDDEAQCMSES